MVVKTDRLANQIAGILMDHNTHDTLSAACAEFGMSAVVPDDTGSKRKRVFLRLADRSLDEIASIAAQVGARYRDLELEEEAFAVLEEDQPPITEITRRDLARCFDPPPLSGELGILDLLLRMWPIDMMGEPFLTGKSLADEIRQHMVRNDDWTAEYLFERLGALSCSRNRFCRLLEMIIHPLARRGPEQEELKDRLNGVLARDGYGLEVDGAESGYPIYRIEPISQGVVGRPKNLIFASDGPKPEIGFSDAINNDIVILSNATSCLVYDRPIKRDGLLWSELVDWWCEEHCPKGTTEDVGRQSLGRRLRDSLASDGERGLFNQYFRCFRTVLGNDLPALVPQVYLHYDPAVVARLRDRASFPRHRRCFRTVLGNDLPALVPQVYLHYDPAVVARLRDRASFPRQRMDFLLLLPAASAATPAPIVRRRPAPFLKFSSLIAFMIHGRGATQRHQNFVNHTLIRPKT